MNMKLRLGGHWLAFLWTVTAGQGNLLKEAVAKAKSAKATVFELIYHVLNRMSASETAQALKDGGMNRAVMCVFFPDGEGGAAPPMGDPLSEDNLLFQKAVSTFRQVLTFITELRTFGIEIDLIVGPSCWVLGKEYHDTQPGRRILLFFKALEQAIKKTNVRVAIELLRAEEDRVVQNIDNAIDIIDMLNRGITGDRFGFHYDSFHLDERGFQQGIALRRLGKRTLHLHINGSGRRPAGGEGDTIDWTGRNGVLTVFKELNLLREIGTRVLVATNEPFCALVRQNCPLLGVGLPDPVDEPGGINTTCQMLEKNGVEIIQ